MDSVCADTSLNTQQPAAVVAEAVPEQVDALETVNNAEPPANDSSTSSNAADAVTATPSANPEPPQTYDDLFPSLPSAAPGMYSRSPRIVWFLLSTGVGAF